MPAHRCGHGQVEEQALAACLPEGLKIGPAVLNGECPVIPSVQPERRPRIARPPAKQRLVHQGGRLAGFRKPTTCEVDYPENLFRMPSRVNNGKQAPTRLPTHEHRRLVDVRPSTQRPYSRVNIHKPSFSALSGPYRITGISLTSIRRKAFIILSLRTPFAPPLRERYHPASRYEDIRERKATPCLTKAFGLPSIGSRAMIEHETGKWSISVRPIDNRFQLNSFSVFKKVGFEQRELRTA